MNKNLFIHNEAAPLSASMIPDFNRGTKNQVTVLPVLDKISSKNLMELSQVVAGVEIRYCPDASLERLAAEFHDEMSGCRFLPANFILRADPKTGQASYPPAGFFTESLYGTPEFKKQTHKKFQMTLGVKPVQRGTSYQFPASFFSSSFIQPQDVFLDLSNSWKGLPTDFSLLLEEFLKGIENQETGLNSISVGLSGEMLDGFFLESHTDEQSKLFLSFLSQLLYKPLSHFRLFFHDRIRPPHSIASSLS